ncbi:filamentous hemagglutinin N-terminal domain-containing protein [Nostoc sp. XA010]|uniref:two-partner secretion domain-containing protein n=1 Tax=Nostoc sp. XA010 TaxID=2780407 RepID=UPI001E5DCA6E|nr:filamentous hemagglutinin N-terminal domain-containing protein [Nostoc sp. XA010]MCC5661334.1 filamentous hemagglutinin N-terminal domain-containing protein [Nostoc sp. XA010]
MVGITQDWRCWCSSLAMGSLLIASSQEHVFAQITPDGTLPNNSIVTPDGSTLNITGGTQAGGNLFHSFGEFSVPTGGVASFNNAVNIQNIISRVTGGSASIIDGIIRANGTANLFLINPSGIIFGQGARLDIKGSFVGTTANAIGFGSQGFFNATNPNTPELLTVNPSALLFNQIKTASIQNNSIAPSGLNPTSEFIATGLRVPDSKSLLLVGGDINMDGGGLFAFGGRVELGGLASAGTIELNGDGNNLSMSFPNSVERSNVSLNNGVVVDVTASDGGSIAVNAQNLEMTGKSRLSTGIATELGSDNSKAGNVEVNATGAISLDNGSQITNEVGREANGQAGDINISAKTLQVKGGGLVATGTFGAGKGGNLTVDAQDIQLIGTTNDGLFPSALYAVTENSTGDAGNLTIKTNTLLVRDGAQVVTGTTGAGKGGNLTVDAQDIQLIGSADRRFPSGLFASTEPGSTGDAGDLTIKTNTLLIEDGALVFNATFGAGKGGNLTVDAQDIQLNGSADRRFPTSLSAQAAGPNSTGDAGNLTIKTNTLLIEDGAQVNAATFGAGKGGNLTVDAQDIQLIGRNGQTVSALFTSAEPNSTGNAGNLTIKTNTLLVRDGAQVVTGTNGAGKGGNLTVDAQDIQLIGSADRRFSSGLFASTDPNSIGDAGDLTIKTNTLLVRDGALVSTGTRGGGKGGNLTVDAQDVQIIGISADGSFPTGLFASTDFNSTGDAGDLTIKTNTLLLKDEAQVSAGTNGAGKGGNLTIKTNTLLLKDGAQVSAGTFGEGKGGNLSVDAQDVQIIGISADGSFPTALFASTDFNSTGDAGDLTIKTNTLLLKDGAQVSAGTRGGGKGGNLSVDAQDVQIIGISADGSFGSGLSGSAEADSTGDAGDLTIKTNTLLVRDGAAITVQSLGTGIAGIMTLNSPSIRLDNNALLSANTRSAKVDPNREQATINISSENLIMSRNSNIITNATGKDVIGGNININTDFLIASGNSDIRADSANFRGGNVQINAQGGIFGIQFRDIESDSTSDITATGASSDLSGSVELSTPGIDPNSGLIELPTVPVDTQLAQGCYSPGYAQNRFVITGRGGLPPSPKDILTPDATQIDWVPFKLSNNNRSLPPITNKPTTSTPKRIVEATGAVLNAKGQIVLSANSSTATPHTPRQNPIQCQSNSKFKIINSKLHF